MGCFACRVKHEVRSLQEKVSRLESGEEIQRLSDALEKEKQARIKAEERAERLKAKVEHRDELLRKAKAYVENLKDQIVWTEEERDKLKDELAECRRSSKKKIDELEKVLSTAQWKIEKVKRDAEKEKAAEIRKMKAEYEEELAKKDKEIQILQEQVKTGGITSSAGTKGAGERANSRNSSVPPGQDPTHQKITNNRESSGKPQGGQKGHKFNPRKAYTVKEPVMLPDPPEVQAHPEDYYCIGEIRKQKVSVRVVVEVEEYVAKEYRHHRTRKKVHAEFPDGVGHLEVNYDESVEAFAMYLHSVANVPYNKVQEILREETDGLLNISTGKLANMEKKFQSMTDEERQAIGRELLAGKYMNIDGTMVRSNGKQRQILVMRNKKAVLYKMTGCKGDKAVEGTPAEHYQGTVVCDSEATFVKLGSRRQGCIIHEGRYLVRAMENTPDLTWHKDMYDLLIEVNNRKKNDATAGKKSMKRADQEEIRRRWDEIVNRGIQEYMAILPGVSESTFYDKDEKQKMLVDKDKNTAPKAGKEQFLLPSGLDLTKDINLLKRLRQKRDEYLLFLDDYSLPSHNNDAEKSARSVKIHMKPNGGMRSDDYVGHYADTASVLETERMKGRSRYKKIRDVFGRKSEYARKTMKEALERRKTTLSEPSCAGI